MTGEVNTDALRGVALGVGQVADVEEDADQASWLRYVQRHVTAAAVEVDRLRLELDEGDQSSASVIESMGNAVREITRLRAAIENAPHDYTCYAGKLAVAKCTCWKADVQ